MTIECYYSDCLYHSCHEIGQEGPFCYEEECKATEYEQEQFEMQRRLLLNEKDLQPTKPRT